MASERVFVCGPAREPKLGPDWRAAPVERLCLGERSRDVHLRIEHLSRSLCARLPDVAVDLVELASYVYAADQAVSRGGRKQFDYGLRWRRRFHFEVPVRRPRLWQQARVRHALADTLGFLSDDDYQFGFCQHPDPPPIGRYLFDEAEPSDVGDYRQVQLFSGGLDSLAGAVQEVLQGHRKVVLVSHRPVSKVYRRQCEVVSAIRRCLRDSRLRPLHVAVEVNKGGLLDHEFTQRTRSFLFAALAAVVALVFGLDGIRFYENGVTSLNLPLSPQVLGGRASRTTHPRALNAFRRLFSELFGCDFGVENPFLWKTKAQVLAEVRAAGFGHLCALTVSCSHTHESTAQHPHCGRCSQCIDRRLSALAAGLGDQEDPPTRYASDVLTGPREGADLTLIERYYGTALRVEGIPNPTAFLVAYGELARALRYAGEAPGDAARDILDLYQRHGRQIVDAVAEAAKPCLGDILRRRFPPNCLLGVAFGSTAGPPPTSAGDAGAGVKQPSDEGLVLDTETFALRYGGRPCFFGNTIEFRLLTHLQRRLGRYVSFDTLRAAVWQDEHTEKNTIQRTVSNIRRRLRGAGVTGVAIDGKQHDHLALVLT